MPSLIAAYLDALATALAFDPALARRMREEAEDHIRETLASDPAGETVEAIGRALARFGTVHGIAAQFVVPSLLRQARTTGAATMLIVLGVLVAMKSRLAWYAASGMAANPSWEARFGSIRAITYFIDRDAFWCALTLAVFALIYVVRMRPSVAQPAVWRKNLRRSLVVYALATIAIITTVAADAVLTAMKLLTTPEAATFLIPGATMAVEVALTGILARHIRAATRRLTAAAPLFPA